MHGITDNELLNLPVPDPPTITVKHQSIAARAAIENHPSSIGVIEPKIEMCQKLSDALYRGTKFTSLGAYTKDVYTHLCLVRNLQTDGQKEDLYDRLNESVCHVFFQIYDFGQLIEMCRSPQIRTLFRLTMLMRRTRVQSLEKML
jgi:hypothetical protein